MKKLSMVVILALILCAGVFISSLLAAEITYIKGKVQVQIAPSREWKSAAVGMKVKIGDSVQTARGSRVDIVLDDDTLRKNFIRVDQNTLMIINSTVPGEINRFDVSQGKIYANIENAKAGITYEVSSPSSVAGVRGTGWSSDIQRDRDEVACYEREIYLKTYDQNKNLISEVTIPEGFKTSVERFEQAGPLLQLTSGERSRWSETKSDVVERMGGGTGGGPDIEKQSEQINEVVKATVEEVSQIKEQIEDRRSEQTLEDILRECGHEY